MMLLPEPGDMSEEDGVGENRYGSWTAAVGMAGGGRVRVEQETDYPVSVSVAIRITPDRARAFAVRLRIPAWSARSSVTVNGTPVDGVRAGEYARIERTWRAGEEVRLELDLQGRVV